LEMPFYPVTVCGRFLRAAQFLEFAWYVLNDICRYHDNL
jgi:hypothetical protein